MANAKVKANHLHYNGKNYFRVGSEDVQLVSYGEKKSPITQGNYLEVQDRLPIPKIKVRKATVVDIDFSKSTKADVLANVNVAGVFGASSGKAYESLKEGRLKLVKLIVENEDVESAINKSPKARNNLIDYGNDARVAHQIFVVLEATLAKKFAASKTFDVSVKAGVVNVSVNGGVGASGQTSVSLSKGSTFAYGLAKLDWDAKQKKNKTKVTKVTDDQWGPN